MALTLARPEGNGAGSRGLALFFVELRDANGRLRNIQVNRLKDKLGTRKVPTAELTLDGTPATLVGAPSDGVRADHADAVDHAHVERGLRGRRRCAAASRSRATTRAGARRSARCSSTSRCTPTRSRCSRPSTRARSASRSAARSCSASSSTAHDERAERLARALVPIAKLTTGKQAVAVASEAIEAFGGAGYIEDTGLPRILADAQVLPIWEGTTNVLSLDTLRALGKGGALEAITAEVEACCAAATDPGLAKPVEAARAALRHATAWVAGGDAARRPARGRCAPVRADARPQRSSSRCSVGHAQWCLDHGHGPRLAAAARRFALNGVDQIGDAPLDDTQLLA